MRNRCNAPRVRNGHNRSLTPFGQPTTDMDKTTRINDIIEGRLRRGNFRQDVYNMIPAGTGRVLEFGYGDGSLLLRLKRDKGCGQVFGIEINERTTLELFDGGWGLDLNDPECDIPQQYHSSFDYLVSMNTLEHIFDPWYVLAKLRQYLVPGGKAILEVPNVQCWESAYRILCGDFPYCSGAHFDFTHVRWYTLQSFAEVLGKAGFEVEGVQLILNGVNLDHLNQLPELREIQLPPPEVVAEAPRLTITYPTDIKRMYPLFLAPRFIFQCAKTDADIDVVPTRADGGLEYHRETFQNPLRLMQRIFPDPVHPTIMNKIKNLPGAENIRSSL